MEENKLSNSDLSRLRRSSQGLLELATPATLRTPETTSIPWPCPSEAALRDHKQHGEEHVTRLQQLLHMQRSAQTTSSDWCNE